MNTMVESPMVQEPPMGEDRRSVSPAGSRKRAFEEVDGAVVETQRDAGIEPKSTAQEVSVPKPENECPPPLNVITANGLAPIPNSASIPPTTTGTENRPIEPVPMAVDPASSAAVAPPPAPIPTPKTPISIPTMPNKKVKLSPASLEAKRIEKEIRDRQRAEEKAKKEEEKRIREVEKKKREEEREEERKKREEKKKVKEEERLAKEEEKRKKEEEKRKKERSQMRLNAFFTKPTPSNTAAATAKSGTAESGSENAASSTENGDGKSTEPAPKPLSDYERDFPEFFLQSHTSVAPMHRFGRDEDALRHVREKVDSLFTTSDTDTSSTQSSMPFRTADLFHMMPYKRRRGKQKLPPVKEILIKMQGSSSNPINLTEEKAPSDLCERPEAVLRKIPVKSLKFSEDVRPPYQGTFTRPIPEQSALRLSRNPFKREMPGIDYDYDSEAEWEEPEEGEDLDSEGEEEMSDEGDEDMNDFLDDADEDQPNPKRKLIVGDLEPACSGLCWEDESGTNTDLSEYRIEIISDLPQFKFPIDPYTASYWQTTPSARNNANSAKGASNQAQNKVSNMHPPPIPINGTNEANTSNLLSWAQPNSQSLKGQPSHTNPDNSKVRVDANNLKPKRAFPPEQLAELKEIVDGSDLTKIGLVEIMKKRFPKVSKGLLRDTLTDVAVRVGDKEADKKWVLKP